MSGKGEDVTYRAVDVAEYVLQKSSQPMSSFKLQKIVYYAQAWSLAIRNRSLFSEPIEAWVNGPVCKALYERHRGRYHVHTINGDASEITDPEDRAFLDDVFRAYNQFHAHTLVTMTHNEAPWIQARRGRPLTDHSNEEIDQDLMRRYYAELAQDATAKTIQY